MINKCDHYKTREAKIRLTSTSGDESLCMGCYNEMNANNLEIMFENLLESISIQDNKGVSHHFKIEQRLLPVGFFLEAEETIKYGYKFSVYGELECSQSALFKKLVDKIKRGISTQYMKEGTFPNGQ